MTRSTGLPDKLKLINHDTGRNQTSRQLIPDALRRDRRSIDLIYSRRAREEQTGTHLRSAPAERRAAVPSRTDALVAAERSDDRPDQPEQEVALL